MSNKTSLLAALAAVNAAVMTKQPVDMAPLNAQVNDMLTAFDSVVEQMLTALETAQKAIEARDNARHIAQQMGADLAEIVAAYINRQHPQKLTTVLDNYVQKHVRMVKPQANNSKFH